MLEPKQIEELAMLHPKDTKEHLYQMFKEAFIVAHVSDIYYYFFAIIYKNVLYACDTFHIQKKNLT